MSAETRNKTITVATYPDGRRQVIRKVRGYWVWSADGMSSSSHYESAVAQAREAGATVSREPNPNYKPRLHTFEKLMKGVLG